MLTFTIKSIKMVILFFAFSFSILVYDHSEVPMEEFTQDLFEMQLNVIEILLLRIEVCHYPS